MTQTVETIRENIRRAVRRVRESNPMAPSITNNVTINLVANVQLALGGSAAMVYVADEGEGLARQGGAMYLNMGTQMPVYEEAMPRTAKVLHALGKNWVLDPVGIGLGGQRERILRELKSCKPSIVRGNASEILMLAELWELKDRPEGTGTRGTDAQDSVRSSVGAALALARYTGGAVAVSGKEDLVTDGSLLAFSSGGSRWMPCVTGAGCSLGGAAAVYASVTDPFTAALTATQAFNFAGRAAEPRARGNGSFQVEFLDALCQASPEDIAGNPFHLEEAEQAEQN
jgi:hydroxyethylthiazole kinase